MRFALDSSHTDFAASLDKLLAGADLPGVIRAYADGDTARAQQVWGKLAETGVNALAIAEEHDGAGAEVLDLVVAAEQLGRHAVPGPVAETVAVVPELLRQVAPDRLGALAAGELATVAIAPHAPLAVDADKVATTYVVEDGVLSVATVGDGHASVDPARRLFDVTAGEALGSVDVSRAQDLGALVTAAQLLGLGQRMLEISTEYAGSRKQFGRVIGSFQAIKHHLASVAVAIEMARPLLHAAALAFDTDADTLARDVSAAKVAAAEAAYLSSRIALQVHGAIGYTQEYDLSLYLTRTRALVSAWGTTDAHRDRVVEQLVTT